MCRPHEVTTELLLCDRVLAFGIPSDRAVHAALTDAAVEIAQELVDSSNNRSSADVRSCLGTLTSLVEALLIGLPSLKQTELQAACSDVLQTLDGSRDTDAAVLLAENLRSVGPSDT